jgi:predicted CXXCH cytochrome family protein
MHCHEMRPVHRLVSELPFYDGYLECSTCHDVHNGSGYEKMLRKPAEQGQLCKHCHW